jgi:hypothetical protein
MDGTNIGRVSIQEESINKGLGRGEGEKETDAQQESRNESNLGRAKEIPAQKILKLKFPKIKSN